MTRTQSRLAELEAIRDRSLTDAEQAEVKRLAHLDRQCQRRRERYEADPGYRETMVRRSIDWRAGRYADPSYRLTKVNEGRRRASKPPLASIDEIRLERVRRASAMPRRADGRFV